MSLKIREVQARSILSKSGIPRADYCINPYVGCSHGCRYCYATFMKRYTSHSEPWGTFVDIKINGPEVLRKQMPRAARGNIILSSVTDPYQPVEARYKLTRQCLQVLLPYKFSVDILTKSPLVLRDIDLIGRFQDLEVGMTITTDDDRVRRIFEPHAAPVQTRIQALKTLHDRGIRTYVFIGPILPMNPDLLAEEISPYADAFIIDRMNYMSKVIRIYEHLRLGRWLENGFLSEIIQRLEERLAGKPVHVC